MEIMDELIAKLNQKMVKESRKILLFLDNVSDLVDSFSNVEVVFLPVHTTARLQPLDAGIIKNFKSTTGNSFSALHYRELLKVPMRMRLLFASLSMF